MTNNDDQTNQNPVKPNHNLEDKPKHEVNNETYEKETTVDEEEPSDTDREEKLPGAEENEPVEERGPRAGQDTEERDQTDRDPMTEKKKSEIY